MKNTNTKSNIHNNATPAVTNAKSEAFFADGINPREEARKQTAEALTRLLIWFAEGANATQRGVRVAVALYCVRPDLINGMTLEQIGDMGGIGSKAVFSIAKDFRTSMGLSA